MESCKIHVKARCHQLTISGFVAEERFRGDLAFVANTSKHWRGCLYQPRQLQVLINTGRCSYCACRGRPYCLMRSRSPQQTCVRLVLPPRKNVVLKLRPQGQPEFILYDCDLVLHERTVNVV